MDQLVPAPPARPSRSASPAEAFSTPVDGERVVGALSPSRVSDFLTCPLLYRFRTVDRLPEPPSPAAVRGTLVHKVLEDVFDLPAHERTPEAARGLLPAAWEAVQATRDDAAELAAVHGAADGAVDAEARWLREAGTVLDRWFSLEDPTRLEPAERESYVEAVLGSGLLLRGFVDRIDVAPDGRIRVVDYKTGRAPGPGFEAKALFQMRFYALVLWRARGVVPSVLQLVYLGSGEVLRHSPDEAELLATERKVEAVWRAINAARESGDWRPRAGQPCSWCAHRALCPEQGGTPPPLPGPAA